MNSQPPSSPTNASVTDDRRTARRRSRPKTSLFAHGEPMVWLTGGALVIALLMIAGLLVLILYQGVSTFWPQPVTQVTTHTGRQLMGEITRVASFEPEQGWLDMVEPEYQNDVAARLEATDGILTRKLIRTGNFRLSGTRFDWVEDFRIPEDGTTIPEWAVLLERREWGRFYGIPAAFLIAGEVQTTDPSEFWSLFEEHHSPVVERAKQIRNLERVELGRVNTRIERARLDFREVEIEVEKIEADIINLRGRLAGLENTDADASAVYAELERQLEEHLAELAAAEARIPEAEERFNDRVVEAQSEADAIKEEIDALRAENEQYQMILTTADGQDADILLADVVRAYLPNQLTFGDKVGIYLSRWGEFLTADPREANQEGGVYPAIFGTVAMTLIMCIAVVPFGVLAALYLREYAKAGPLISAVRIAINNLAGVPSIVFGVFGLGFFSYIVGKYIDGGPKEVGVTDTWSTLEWNGIFGVWIFALIAGVALFMFAMPKIRATSPLWMRTIKGLFGVGWGIVMIVLAFMLLQFNPYFEGFFEARLPNPTFGKGGLLWASLTLALLTLPVVIVATEEALAAVPNSMREGSYACGASKWQTIKRIVLPRAMPGIMTGMILAMARGAGEVAPLMVVGAVKLAPKLPVDGEWPFIHAERSFMHLGFHIYDLGFQSPDSEAAKPMVFTTTLLLITIVAALNVSAILIRSRLRRKFSGTQF
ncbi:MAG: ABC transporter permease subunit [Planctomycetota bacterium]